jgi:hypothetical protein
LPDHFAAAFLVRGNKPRATRVLTLQDGGTITEKLKKYNEEVANTAAKGVFKGELGNLKALD